MGILSLYPRFINFLKLITFEKNIQEKLKYYFPYTSGKIEALYEEYLLNNPKGLNDIVFRFDDLEPESNVLIAGDVSTRGYFDLYLDEIENIHQLKFIVISAGAPADIHTTNYCNLSDLKAFQNLEVLYISFEVINIDLLQLTYLKNIKVLHLQSFEIRELDPQYSLPNVKSHLILFNEPAGSLKKAIPRVSRITELSLICTKEEVIPPEISSLIKLEKILLQATSINKIPKEIGKLKNLKHLVIRNNNNLTELPSEIGALQNLTTIELINNSITSFPSEIGKLEKLSSLNLGSNLLISLPRSIGNLKLLEELNLSHNCLDTLPESIGELKNLRSLDLMGNRLVSLPDSIGQLNNLRDLDLRNNTLVSLPDSIGQLVDLQYIHLTEGKHAEALKKKIGFLLPSCEVFIE